ncbi:hypothetical protein ADL03_13745 [Nocardia sp. NRRL S-836]|nr:hypothetical protein ADL03_13745 [Nocardia sp. NRRL S-836]
MAFCVRVASSDRPVKYTPAAAASAAITDAIAVQFHDRVERDRRVGERRDAGRATRVDVPAGRG